MQFTGFGKLLLAGKAVSGGWVLQFMIERLLASSAPEAECDNEDQDETGDSMKLTSIQSITDFITCAGKPCRIISGCTRRNLAVARSHEVSAEERRHAQRALSMMMNIQWKHNNYFEAIDLKRPDRFWMRSFYGMERVKQRIMETIIQINRTHTLPAYGLLLVGPDRKSPDCLVARF